MKQLGIYFIRNTINNRCYIGSSNYISRRWNAHKSSLNKNKHHSPHLQHAWNKYGEQSFVFEIAEEVDENHLIWMEQQYLDTAKLMSFMYYNTDYIAGKPPSHKGKIMSDRQKKAISIAHKGVKLSKEHIENSRLARVGMQIGIKNSTYNDTKYIFVNVESGEQFNGTQFEFYMKYNLKNHKGNINSMIKKRFNKCGDPIIIKNWSVA